MSIFCITCIATASLSLGFGIFIALNRKKSTHNSPIWLWVSFCFAVAFWSLGLGMMTVSKNAEIATNWLRIHYFGAILIPTLYLHFILAFLEKENKFIVGLLYSITIIFQISSLSGLLSIVIPKPPFNFYTAPGKLYNIYSLYFFICVVYGHSLLFKTLKNSSGYQRNQIYFLFLGTAIGVGGGSTAFFPVYDIPVFPFGVPFTAIYVFIVGYSILIYRLMDFGLLMRWGLAFGSSFGIIGLIFLIIAGALEYVNKYYVHFSIGFPTIIATCFGVLLFDPVRKKVTKLIDRIIFKSPDFQLLLDGIEKELNQSGSLDSITSGISLHLKKILNTGHGGFVMWNPSAAHFELFPSNAFNSQIINRIREPITQTDFLIKTMETERRLFKYGIVTEEELTALGNRSQPGERTTFWKIRRTMRWLGAAICIPLMLNEHLIGFIVLGSKVDSSYYNAEDKKFLAHVSDMVSNVIKNHITGFFNKSSVSFT